MNARSTRESVTRTSSYCPRTKGDAITHPVGKSSQSARADAACGGAEGRSAVRRAGRGRRQATFERRGAAGARGSRGRRRSGNGAAAAVGEPRLLDRRRGPRPLLAGRLVELAKRRRCAGRALRRAAPRLRRARRAERGCEWPLRDAHVGGPRPIEACGISGRARRGARRGDGGRGGRRRAGRARWLGGGARPPAAHEPKLVDSPRSARSARVMGARRALRRGGRSQVRQGELG